MSEDYKCVMVPPKLKRLKSKTSKVIVHYKQVRNFSIDKNGKKIDGGITFNVLDRIELVTPKRRKVKKFQP